MCTEQIACLDQQSVCKSTHTAQPHKVVEYTYEIEINLK